MVEPNVYNGITDAETQKKITENLLNATQKQADYTPGITPEKIQEQMPMVQKIYEPQIKAAQEQIGTQWANAGRYISGRSQKASSDYMTQQAIPQMTQLAMNLAQQGDTAKQQQLKDIIASNTNLAQLGQQSTLQKSAQDFSTQERIATQGFSKQERATTQDWQSTQSQLDRDLQLKVQQGNLTFEQSQKELDRKLTTDLQNNQLTAEDKQLTLNRLLQQSLQQGQQMWSTAERESTEGMNITENVPMTDANGNPVYANRQDANGNLIQETQKVTRYISGTKVEEMKQQSLLNEALQMKDQTYQDKVRESMYGYQDPKTGKYVMGTQAMFSTIQNDWETARQNTQNLFSQSIQEQSQNFQSNMNKASEGYVDSTGKYIQGTKAKLIYLADTLQKGQLEMQYNMNRASQSELNAYNAWQADIQRAFNAQLATTDSNTRIFLQNSANNAGNKSGNVLGGLLSVAGAIVGGVFGSAPGAAVGATVGASLGNAL